MRSLHPIGLLVVIQLGLPVAALAQFTPAEGREYREVFNPTNPVRGEAVIGVAIVPKGTGPQSRAVEVWMPESFKGDLHVETATADGRFRGEGVYRGSGNARSWVTLALTPKDGKDQPLPGDTTTLAVAVRGPGQTFYVPRWGNQGAGAGSQLRVYVNSRRADMFIRAGQSVSRCTPINVTQPLRFDHYCDVALTAIPADGQLVLIRRDQSDEQTQTFTVNVRELR